MSPLVKHLRAVVDGRQGLHTVDVRAAADRIEALEREVEVLRRYGNKDCTAMADAELNGEEE